MEANGEWKIWAAGDCGWYVARTREEAIAAMCVDELCEDEADLIAKGFLEPQDMIELADASLDHATFVEMDENEEELEGPEHRRTFREELARQVAAGLAAPELFARKEF